MQAADKMKTIDVINLVLNNYERAHGQLVWSKMQAELIDIQFPGLAEKSDEAIRAAEKAVRIVKMWAEAFDK